MTLSQTDARTVGAPGYSEEIARIIWTRLAPSIAGDYSDVPFEDLMRRPRYSGLRELLLKTAKEIALCQLTSSSPSASSNAPRN